jgi:hypothetical protein
MERNTGTLSRDRSRGRVRPGSQHPSVGAGHRSLGRRQQLAISEFRKWDRQMTARHGALYHRRMGWSVH